MLFPELFDPTTNNMRNYMSRNFPVLILCMFSLTIAVAQEKTHEGFYFSMSLGPVFGNIKAKTSNGESINIKGTGP